jgi:ubiquinone/menaquinone biosynthesis C-methylase UbiE
VLPPTPGGIRVPFLQSAETEAEVPGMPEQDQIYRSQAEGYERLIEREDHQGNLLRALQSIASMRGKDIIDMGAGTGRFTCMLCGLANSVLGLDVSLPMLQVARSKLQSQAPGRWQLIVSDNRHMPLGGEAADVVLADWTFGHATVWYGDRWREEIGPAIGEMMRLLRPGGTGIICETLGTASLEPGPPTETLAAYYRFLESDLAFARMAIPTDYRFPSLEEAVETIQFFFGAELAAKVRKNRWVVVPEWTGLWWRQK